MVQYTLIDGVKLVRLAFILLINMIFLSFPCYGDRIKDLTSLQGVRVNQLIGYGLVVGLDGTGDATNQAVFTAQTFKTMLNKFGIRIPDNVNLQTANVAAVLVSAELPPFAKPGQKMDITVSSIGNAKSLRGGTLLLTPLKGADGRVYAMAQGNMTVSGFGSSGADGSKITVNIPSAGRIPNGATIERPSPTTFAFRDIAVYNLHTPDFTTAVRLTDIINSNAHEKIAKTLDAASIAVHLPSDPQSQMLVLAKIESLQVNPSDVAAKVVINSRTGTVVIGKHVVINPAAVSHGSLTVTVSEDPNVSQPRPFSLGTTAVVPDSEVQLSEEDKRAFLFDPGVTLQDLVNAINSVGASPSDLVAILDSLKTAGALRGELVII